MAPSAPPSATSHGSKPPPLRPDRVISALEDQLKCEANPEPGKALRALKTHGYIGSEPRLAIDGMTIWQFTKPVSVFGFKALEVTGWEDKPDGVFFWRAPGTAPSVHISVIVEGDPRTVEAYLKRVAGSKTMVGKPYSLLTSGKPTAEITCYGKL